MTAGVWIAIVVAAAVVAFVLAPLRRDRRSGVEFRSQYLDWNHAIGLPDHLFEPPSDVELEPVGYDDYVERSKKGAVGPAPPFYADLLHGRRE